MKPNVTKSEKIENHVHEKRKALGLSQEKLANTAGITRQAICAIEAGQYVPSTSVALHLAKAFNCRVEDLFRLGGAEPVLEGECLGSVPEQSRVKVFHVGSRTLIQQVTSLGGFPSLTEQADGIVIERPGKQLRAKVRLLRDQQTVERQIVVAGCNPAMFLASECLSRIPETGRLLVRTMGSEAALNSLKRGHVHVAGVHIVDERSGESNRPYLRRHLNAKDFIVTTFASWEQGLVVGNRNPKSIRRIDDLGREDVRVINRESGSGARRLLDRQLQAVGLIPEQIRGYEHSVGSHLEVAWCIKQGLADVGVGVRAAAQLLGLEFIPLQEERYDLVIPKAYLDVHPTVKIFLDTLVSRSFRSEIEALGGYDIRDTGKVIDLCA